MSASCQPQLVLDPNINILSCKSTYSLNSSFLSGLQSHTLSDKFFLISKPGINLIESVNGVVSLTWLSKIVCFRVMDFYSCRGGT